MKLLKNLFKPKALRLFEQSLSQHDYSRAMEIIESGGIPEHRIAEARSRRLIYDAVAEAEPTRQSMQVLERIADKLQSQAAVDTLQEPDRTSLYLAVIASALNNKAYDAALDLAGNIRPREGHAQALRKIAAHMACNEQEVQSILQVLSTLPQPAYIAEELRNFFLSRILCRSFDDARTILDKIPHNIRKGLEPQLKFVERNHHDIQQARLNARDLVHPDDIALTMALTAGANDDLALMTQYSRDVSPQLFQGTHATYAISLAYAGRTSAAIALLDQIRNDMQEYLLRLGYLAFAFPLPSKQMEQVSNMFSNTEPYEPSLAFWYHCFLEHLVEQRSAQIEELITRIKNQQLRSALAGLFAEFITVVS